MDLLLNPRSTADVLLLAGAATAVLYTAADVVRGLASYGNPKHSAGPAKYAPKTDGTHSRYFRSDVNGLWIYHRTWRPVGEPRATVYLLHGYGEHCGRYECVGAQLSAAGFVVHALDHAGHGQSEGDRAYFESFAQPVADILQLVEKEHPTRGKRFLVGHSMGGLLALLTAAAKPQLFAGVVLSGPALALDPRVDTPVNRLLASALSSVLPKLPVTPLDPDTLSSDPEVVSQYLRDPLVYHGNTRIRTGAEFIASIKRALEAAPSLTMPLLIVHGAQDRLCGPEGSRALMAAIGSEDKTLKLYEGMRHEVFFEKGGAGVVDDVVAWLTAHC